MEQRIGRGFPPRLCHGVLLLSLASPIPAVAEDPWSTAEAAAISEWKNAEGKNYGKTLEATFVKEHGATLTVCAKETENPDLSNFTVLLSIDSHGVVEQVMVKPETNIAICLKGKLTGWKTTPPPHENFWAKLGLKLKSK
jgi:hypothetical protein